VGKRRGNAPVLKTGAVKKARVQEKDEVGGTRLASGGRVITT